MVFYAYDGFRRRKRRVQFTITYVVCTYVRTRARTSTLSRMPRDLDATGTRAQTTKPEAKCLQTSPPKIPMSQFPDMELIRTHTNENDCDIWLYTVRELFTAVVARCATCWITGRDTRDMYQTVLPSCD